MNKKHKVYFLYVLILTGVIAWLGVIFLAPYLKSQSLSLNIFIYSVFSPICHQTPSRSFFFYGQPLAVCGRCLGIYSGFFIGTLLYPFLKGFSNTDLPKTRIFVIFSIPIVIDTMGNFLHLWLTPNVPRFFIGFLWGLILPFYFIAGITDLLLNAGQPKEKFD